jgi:hypothetical protein
VHREPPIIRKRAEGRKWREWTANIRNKPITISTAISTAVRVEIPFSAARR